MNANNTNCENGRHSPNITGRCLVCGFQIPHYNEDPPIPMRLPCEQCGKLHIDEGVWVTRYHHTHACQHCGAVWRPALEYTIGVRFLPGYKNE